MATGSALVVAAHIPGGVQDPLQDAQRVPCSPREVSLERAFFPVTSLLATTVQRLLCLKTTPSRDQNSSFFPFDFFFFCLPLGVLLCHLF